MPVQNIKLYYSIGEAAKLLGVSIQTLRRWTKDGKITYVRTKGGFRRFPHDKLIKIKKYGVTKLPVFTSKQAGLELGVSFQTLKRWGKKGKLHIFKAANRFFFPKEEIEESELPHSADFFSHKIFPHEVLHVGSIIFLFFLSLYLLSYLSSRTKIASLVYSIPRPITGAISTFIAPFSPQLSIVINSRLKPANDTVAAEQQTITSVYLPG